jgi:hypothetical protein
VGASGENAPSKQLKDAFADLGAQSDEQLLKLKKIMTLDIPAFNKLVLAQQVPVIGIQQQ